MTPTASATPAPPDRRRTEKKVKALEQQAVQMFRNIRPGPFAPVIHDIGRESPTKALPGRNGGPPEAVPAGFLSVLGWRHRSGVSDRSDDIGRPNRTGELDRHTG